MSELLLVDENDNVTGYGEKIDVHRKGQLHRAFSVFLYDEAADSFLLQKRAEGKYHSGGLWSNSCCSHPYRGESWADAIARALKNELSLDVKGKTPGTGTRRAGDDADLRIRELGSIIYFSDFGELKEYEYDHVFLCSVTVGRMPAIDPNPDEVAECKWVPVREIGQMLDEKPELFSAWFPGVFRIAEAGL